LHPEFAYYSKTHYSFEIFSDNFHLILFAIIFAMTLYTQLKREIGIKSLNDEGLVLLGIRAIKVAFRARKTLP